ncbi:UDP-glucose 6-dehydrogenase domain-containing protein (plasmid) [Rhizobium phaseoli]|nr:UDP-glucose 6-dehydrogenase domain-containing protein [Rhizobium phaseoli]
MLGPVTYGEEPYEIADDADAIVIGTEWDEFRALDFKRLKTTVKTPIILRNIYPAAEVSRHGFSYFAVGKKGSANTAG